MANESYNLGKWLSAALEDPSACKEFKADVEAWFNAFMPVYSRPAVAELNITGQEPNAFGHTLFSSQLTEYGKELPRGRYLVYIGQDVS